LIPEVGDKIDFEEGKVLEVLAYAFNRQGFLTEGLVADFMAPARDPFLFPNKFS